MVEGREQRVEGKGEEEGEREEEREEERKGFQRCPLTNALNLA